MKCAACGNENQATAKFCVHCGVMLSPVSMPAAATPGPSPAPRAAPPSPPRAEPVPIAATAALASGGAAPATEAPAPPAAAARVDLTVAESPGAAVSGPPSSLRTPVILGAVAVLIVIAIGFVAYRALYGAGGSRPAATEPTKSAESSPAAQPTAMQAAPEPAKETTGPAAAAPSEPASVTPAETPVKADATPTTAPVAMPGTAATPTKAPRVGQPKGAPKLEASPAETAPPPAPRPAAKAPQVAATPALPAQPDRWQMYADAMGRCAREDFFKRFACEQRTRLQYCEGYWGQVPQCPGAPVRERGQ